MLYRENEGARIYIAAVENTAEAVRSSPNFLRSLLQYFLHFQTFRGCGNLQCGKIRENLRLKMDIVSFLTRDFFSCGHLLSVILTLKEFLGFLYHVRLS